MAPLLTEQPPTPAGRLLGDWLLSPLIKGTLSPVTSQVCSQAAPGLIPLPQRHWIPKTCQVRGNGSWIRARLLGRTVACVPRVEAGGVYQATGAVWG